MCNNPDKKKHPVLAAVMFALTPAIVLGVLATAAFDWPFGLIVGTGLFGLGMDAMLKGKQ